jgi:N-acetylglutamate synthase
MVSIQIFTEQHIPEALDLWRATEHIGLSSADEPPALARYLRRNPGFSFVGIDDGALVGAVLCGHDGRRGFIHHLAIVPSHRRSGIGSQLIDHCLESLRRAGIVKCHAFVFHSNPYAGLFWEPAGWQQRENLMVYSKSIDPDS